MDYSHLPSIMQYHDRDHHRADGDGGDDRRPPRHPPPSSTKGIDGASSPLRQQPRRRRRRGRRRIPFRGGYDGGDEEDHSANNKVVGGGGPDYYDDDEVVDDDDGPLCPPCCCCICSDRRTFLPFAAFLLVLIVLSTLAQPSTERWTLHRGASRPFVVRSVLTKAVVVDRLDLRNDGNDQNDGGGGEGKIRRRRWWWWWRRWGGRGGGGLTTMDDDDKDEDDDAATADLYHKLNTERGELRVFQFSSSTNDNGEESSTCPPLTGPVLTRRFDDPYLVVPPSTHVKAEYWLNPGSILEARATIITETDAVSGGSGGHEGNGSGSHGGGGGSVRLYLFRGKQSYETWKRDPGEYKNNILVRDYAASSTPASESSHASGTDGNSNGNNGGKKTTATIKYTSHIPQVFYVVYENANSHRSSVTINATVVRNLTTFSGLDDDVLANAACSSGSIWSSLDNGDLGPDRCDIPLDRRVDSSSSSSSSWWKVWRLWGGHPRLLTSPSQRQTCVIVQALHGTVQLRLSIQRRWTSLIGISLAVSLAIMVVLFLVQSPLATNRNEAATVTTEREGNSDNLRGRVKNGSSNGGFVTRVGVGTNTEDEVSVTSSDLEGIHLLPPSGNSHASFFSSSEETPLIRNPA